MTATQALLAFKDYGSDMGAKLGTARFSEQRAKATAHRSSEWPIQNKDFSRTASRGASSGQSIDIIKAAPNQRE